MKEELNKAHKDALELLEIVHKFCVQENIVYTISADTLINYGNMEFSMRAPTIYISIMYESFVRLENYIKELCLSDNHYSMHNYTNTKQFYSLDTWFVKKTSVALSNNAEEEFYYGAKLVITPLFFAGSNYKEWSKVYKRYKNVIATYNLPALLPKKPIMSRIRQFPKRYLTNYYRKYKGKCTIAEIRNNLSKNPESNYILYPFVASKYRTPNTIPWVVNKESFYMTRAIWSDVKVVEICGVQCYCMKDVDKYLKCFPCEYIERVKNKKSQLILEGGEKLRRIQLIQVELLKEFDRICRKNNLKYNISFGTLLGAVRHGGFIPWDDDIDVTMPWEDYMKLDEIMKSDLDNEKYYYRTPETEENNHLIFKHLERKGTVYTKPGRNKLKHEIGVFIDIFPMYPAAPNVILDWFHTRICRFWRTALWATVGADSEQNRVKRMYYRSIAKFGNKRCYENFVKAATFFKNSKGNLKFWIAMDRNPYNVALVHKDNYKDMVELEFEGSKFYAPKNYVEVLNYCFGKDWNDYPSTNRRVPAHNAIIDIGNLYEVKEK